MCLFFLAHFSSCFPDEHETFVFLSSRSLSALFVTPQVSRLLPSQLSLSLVVFIIFAFFPELSCTFYSNLFLFCRCSGFSTGLMIPVRFQLCLLHFQCFRPLAWLFCVMPSGSVFCSWYLVLCLFVGEIWYQPVPVLTEMSVGYFSLLCSVETCVLLQLEDGACGVGSNSEFVPGLSYNKRAFLFSLVLVPIRVLD